MGGLHGLSERHRGSGRAARGRARRRTARRGDSVVVDPSARLDLVIAEGTRPTSETLTVQRHFAPAEEIAIPEAVGGHGGGDSVLLRDVFRGVRDDPLGCAATWRDGVRAVVVGIAGNRSLEGGAAVRMTELDLGGAAASLVDRA